MQAPKVFGREQERSRVFSTAYQKTMTGLTQTPPAPTKQVPPPQLKTAIGGAEESPPKSFFERCVNLEYLSKTDSKEFADFIYSLKDQYSTARYIRQSKSHPVEPSKAVRLKRDFKSSLR
jgi:hypothetical protein